MFCKYCGKEIDNDSKFCKFCGKTLEGIKQNNALQEAINKSKTVSDYAPTTNVNNMDSVCLGQYPQDDESGNNKDALEWIVLIKAEGRALLLSKYIIDCKRFNNEVEEGCREYNYSNSSIREWLNNEFYNLAFNDSDQENILSVKIDCLTILKDNNEKKESTDKVFLLSENQIIELFGYDSDSLKYDMLKATCTKFAKKKKDDDCNLAVCGNNGASYWLRDVYAIGRYANASIIHASGNFNRESCNLDFNDVGVRPAIWVALK